MSGETREPIIDSLLEELLGGQQPPNIKQRILASRAERTQKDQPDEQVEHFQLPPSVVAPPPEPVVNAPAVTPVSRNRGQRRQPDAGRWMGAATAVLVLISIGALSVPLLFPMGNHRQVVQQQVEDPVDGEAWEGGAAPPKSRPADSPPSTDPSSLQDSVDPVDPVRIEQPPVQDHIVEQRPSTKKVDQAEFTEGEMANSDEEIIAFINERLALGWRQAEVRPAAAVDSRQWCRRTYQRLVGRQPAADELSRFLKNKERKKRQLLVDRLCSTREFAAHWADIFSKVLIGDTRTLDANRTELQRYLRRSLFENKPYHTIAQELLTATGSNRAELEGFNAAANFLLSVKSSETPTAVTDKVCQVFLGKRMQCAQCHAHPLSGWTQKSYWQFASFFMQMQTLPASNGERLVNRDYPGEKGTPEEAEVYYSQLDGLLHVAYPVYLDGTEFSHSGLLEEFDRRSAVTDKIVRSRDFSRAMVNRIWDQIFGIGFTQPVDDMGPHNPPSHPLLLEKLAGQFQAHQYDLRELMRWMVLSEAFDRGSQVGGESLLSSASSFASFPAERTAPRTPLVVSLRDFARRRQVDKLAQVWNRNNEKNNANRENADRRASAARIDAVLRHQLLDTSEGGLLDRIARSKLSDAGKVNHLFMATVGRTARGNQQRGELREALALFKVSPPIKALQDICWLLLDSPEFAREH